MSELTNDDSAALTLYTTTWCPFCTRLKKLLDETGIGYTEVDVEADASEPAGCLVVTAEA